MKFLKYITAILIALCLLTAGCGQAVTSPTQDGASSSTAVPSSSMQTVSAASSDVSSAQSTYSGSSAASSQAVSFEDNYEYTGNADIVLSGATATSGSSKVTIIGSTVKITSSGSFTVTGSLTDGQITVNANSSDKVTLTLCGVDITCSNGPAILVEQCDKLTLVLADGSTNKVTDGTSYTLADGEDEPNAAVFSRDDLEIEGNGRLIVQGNYKNGILSKDSLRISGATLVVNAVNDALRGRDDVTIGSGNFILNAGADGIQSNNDEDAARGYVLINGGSFSITSGNDGIQAYTTLTVTDGDFSIICGGGAGSATAGSRNDFFKGWGAAAASDTEESKKGLKAGGALTISGGNFKIDSSDDAVHSNTDVTISGGSFTISTGDDGMHADGDLTINSGNINITKSYEGLEGTTVTVYDGTVSVVASDDGINSAGGSDGTPTGFMGGMFSANSDCRVEINGGYIFINAEGDGIDSNGSLAVNGGVTLVSGPTNGGNGALDYNGTAANNGGVLIAAGSVGMVQTVGGNVCCVSVNSSQAAKTPIAVIDSDGNCVASFTPEKVYGNVVISTPLMKIGSSYTVVTGGTAAAADSHGYCAGGSISGGTQIGSFTASASVATVGASQGGMQQGGMQGGNPWGRR